MSKRIRTRLIVIVALTLLCVYLFSGFPPSVENLKKRINLGLDLQGGIQLVLRVKTSDAIRAETDQTIESLRTQLQKENITFGEIARTQDDQFTAMGVDPSKNSDFRRIITEVHPEWDVTSSTGGAYSLQLKQAQAATYRQQSVDQAISTISNRINALGVTEPTIQRRGATTSDQILIQFPGVKDPARVEDIIQSTALLELKIVDGTGSFPSRGSGASVVRWCAFLGSGAASIDRTFGRRQSVVLCGPQERRHYRPRFEKCLCLQGSEQWAPRDQLQFEFRRCQEVWQHHGKKHRQTAGDRSGQPGAVGASTP